LLKKSVNEKKLSKVKLKSDVKKAFYALRTAFITTLLLQHFNPLQLLKLKINASNFALNNIFS
jgi:hypothetical protein